MCNQRSLISGGDYPPAEQAAETFGGNLDERCGSGGAPTYSPKTRSVATGLLDRSCQTGSLGKTAEGFRCPSGWCRYSQDMEYSENTCRKSEERWRTPVITAVSVRTRPSTCGIFFRRRRRRILWLAIGERLDPSSIVKAMLGGNKSFSQSAHIAKA